MSSLAYVVDNQLQRITCCNCGVEFGMVGSYYNKRVEDQDSFHCPNGHRQHFTGKTEAQQLREQLEAEKRRHEMTKNAADQERALRRTAEKGQAIVRGKLGAERKRQAARARAGVCPLGCHRHFINLERHVATKHSKADRG